MIKRSALMAFLLFSSTQVLAEPASTTAWSGQIQIRSYDCEADGKSGIVVSGRVEIIQPDDNDTKLAPKTIYIKCKRITFQLGSILISKSSLDIRMSDYAEGPIKIENTRGRGGADAPTTPDLGGDIWAPRKMTSGANGAKGGDGRDAKKCVEIGHGSDEGGRGSDGQRGQSGLLFAAPKGRGGENGLSAGEIVLITKAFKEGTTVDITANGGAGGAGGRGGRGADGGDGGVGGQGGKGGRRQ